MPTQYYTRHFAKQFRMEHIVYPPAEEISYKNLLLREYGRNKNESALLAEYLSETLHHNDIVECIINKLETKDIPHSRRLFNFAGELNMLFTRFVQEEPFTAHYYEGLITTIEIFCELINTFQEDIREHLSGNLKKLQSGNPETDISWDIDSANTAETIDVVEFYLNNIDAYYKYFTDTLQYESDNKKGIQVTTPVATHLTKLIAFIEKIMIDLQFTHELLFAWEAQMIHIEEQELYN